MKKVFFLLGIHNHQPVGNFEHIFREAVARCYEPFIAILEKHPAIKTSLHYSGPILEWMESERPDILERIHELTDKRQVEMLGGGFYEPIFSTLKERDALGQIQMLADYIRKKFGASPKGIWLAERVWEPNLPRLISLAGHSYTLLDSTHFLYTGLTPEQIRGYFVTEKEGLPISIFPIDMTLRYTIPFEKPEKTIEYLRFLSSDIEEVAVTYGDDGEKFGMWPGTYSWVYEKGWLDAFFSLLEQNSQVIEMVTFSEYLGSHKPQGRIYLPTLSYEEMMEWALPVEATIAYEQMIVELQNLQLKEKYRAFLRGGYWNNFLVKYPESNQMHKKMLLISEKLEQWEKKLTEVGAAEQIESAKRELYQAQCNCPYWHGLFGGVYLNYLRHAVYQHLINTERIIESSTNGNGSWIDYEVYDFNRDLSQEILISGSNFNAYFSAQYGGALFELDFKPRSFNLSNTMTRRMEAYHRKLSSAEAVSDTKQEDGRPVSIHNLAKVQNGAHQYDLVYDWYRRYSFLDHFLGVGTTLETFSRCQYAELGEFVNQPYLLGKINKTDSPASVTMSLSRKGVLWGEHSQVPIAISKRFALHDKAKEIEACYCIKNESTQDVACWFGVEFNFSLLAGNDPLRYYLFPQQNGAKSALNATGTFSQVERFEMKDEWNGLGLEFMLSPNGDVWKFPLETISQSEKGIEKTYQGSTLLTHWKMTLDQDQQKELSIKLRLYEFPGKG